MQSTSPLFSARSTGLSSFPPFRNSGASSSLRYHLTPVTASRSLRNAAAQCLEEQPSRRPTFEYVKSRLEFEYKEEREQLAASHDSLRASDSTELVSGHAFLLSSSRDLCWSLLLTRADASTRGVRGRRSGRDIRKGFDTAGARSGRWLPG